MSKIHFDINIANGVVIDVVNDLLLVWWMEVYPFCLNQSKSLLHAEIKLFNCTFASVYCKINHVSALPAEYSNTSG